jgi:SNF2 family DNA or RNA helicase
MIETYAYKTTPFPHQDDEFKTHGDDVSRGLLWEMGLGKSKASIDSAANLYEQGKIDAMLIVAPGGVHGNWIINELPIHLPDNILAATRMHIFSTKKSRNKGHQIALKQVVEHRGLSVLAMSYDAMTTDNGKKAAWAMLKNRKCMYIADEARRIKTPTADRTKAVVKSATFAPYRRLLNGTPVPNGPFDLYSQMLFLDPNFWHPLGISTFAAFKTFFGVFITGYCKTPNGTREFPQLVKYKNLDILHKHLERLCSRLTKDILRCLRRFTTG